ncbi:MAG: hypothetical protein GF320_14600 [Armatimonadia bacterium]|nr:hypothetical protein [Armatimonadia bacterium]
MTGLFLASVLLAQPADGWHEDFSDATLDPLWRWSVPHPGPELALEGGQATVTVPQRDGGYLLWPRTQGAPILAREAPSDDWRAECVLRVTSYGPDSNFHVALSGLPNLTTFVGWGPFHCPPLQDSPDGPELWLEYMGAGGLAKAEMPDGPVDLALEKRGYTYTAYHRAGDDWIEAGRAIFPFEAPSVGLVFRTWGDGPGITVRVESFSCAPLPEASTEVPAARIRIDAADLGAEVNPWIHGHFLEPLQGCINGGLWAEMLASRKLYGPAEDGVVEPWRPVGQGATFAPDTQTYYSPAQSQRIEATGGEPQGIQQDGLTLEAGREYSARVVLRADPAADCTVALMSGDQVIDAGSATAGTEWQTTTLTLASTADLDTASFRIATSDETMLWVGATSLMPADNVDGMRRDALEAAKALNPPIVRWPGGNFASEYDWRDGIGDRDLRPTRWNHSWNEPEPNDFGTEEFLRFCEEVGAEPYICANLGSHGADLAAAWVEYCNGPADSPHGSLRARAHPEPHHITVWGLGNEMWGDWQMGHLSPERYAIKAVEVARAMRAASPIPLELVGVGVREDERTQWGDWNQRVVPLLHHEMEWHSIHAYQGVHPGDSEEIKYLSAFQQLLTLGSMLEAADEVVHEGTPEGHSPPILSLDEWNISAHPYTIRDALWVSAAFHLMHRMDDRLQMGNLTLMFNVMAPIRVHPGGIWLSPEYYAFRLYSYFGDNFVGRRLPADVQAAPYSSRLPSLDVSAVAEGDTIRVAIINFRHDQAVSVDLDLAGLDGDWGVHEARMLGASWTAGEPGEVWIEEREGSLAELTRSPLPAHSVTLWTLTRAR